MTDVNDVEETKQNEILWCINSLSEASLLSTLTPEQKKQGEGFLAVLCLRYLGAAAVDENFERYNIENYDTKDKLKNHREAFFSRLFRFDKAFDGSSLHALTTLYELWSKLDKKVQEHLQSFENEIDGTGDDEWPELSESGPVKTFKDILCKHKFLLIIFIGKQYNSKKENGKTMQGDYNIVLKSNANAFNFRDICRPPTKQNWKDHESFEIRYFSETEGKTISTNRVFASGLETLGVAFNTTGFDFVTLESMDGDSYNQCTKFNGTTIDGC